MLTVDASVWISAVSPEESQHGPSKALVDRIVSLKIPTIVPTLLRVEIAAAFGRSGKNMSVLRATVDAISLLTFIRWIPLDWDLAVRASDVATAQRLRGADAVYAAVAIANGCKLVSLDNEHLKRMSTVLACGTPSDTLAEIDRN